MLLLMMMLLEFRVLRRRAVKCDDKSVDFTAMESQIHREELFSIRQMSKDTPSLEEVSESRGTAH